MRPDVVAMYSVAAGERPVGLASHLTPVQLCHVVQCTQLCALLEWLLNTSHACGLMLRAAEHASLTAASSHEENYETGCCACTHALEHLAQEESERTLMLEAQREDYGRSQAERDLEWEHNQVFEFAQKLQDFAADDADAYKVCYENRISPGLA